MIELPTEGMDPEFLNPDKEPKFNSSSSNYSYVVSVPIPEQPEQVEFSPLEYIANIAEVANAVASLVVGHRKILVEGGFDTNLSDQMCATLHAKLLGIGPVWSLEDDDSDDWVDDDDDD